MDIKNLLMGALCGLVVLFGGLYFLHPAAQAPKSGALSGPDLPYSYIGVGGLQMFAARGNLNTASTTSCAIQAPAATSSLQYFAANFTGGNQVTVTATLTTGNAMQATTTQLGNSLSIAAGALGSLMATTSSAANFILGPNAWVQVNTTGGAGVSSTTGTCSAEFYVI